MRWSPSHSQVVNRTAMGWRDEARGGTNSRPWLLQELYPPGREKGKEGEPPLCTKLFSHFKSLMSLEGATAFREMKWDEGAHRGHGLVGDTASRVGDGWTR